LDSASGSHGDDRRGEESCGSGSLVGVGRTGVVVVVDDVVLLVLSCDASPLGVACDEVAAAAGGGGSFTMVGE